MAYEIIPTAKGALEITGETFRRLVAIAPIARDNNGKICWLCICKCGSEVVARSSDLRCGKVLSCGCLSKENARKRFTVHNLRQHPIYPVWMCMKDRCRNKNNKAFHNYGGRGITVCNRWKNSFPNFLSDMGECPPNMSLDRIDNDGNYTPKNCRWATREQQNNNTRQCRFITHNRTTLTFAQWSRVLGGSGSLVGSRLKIGWSEKRAVTEPVNR
jgi:hypothetical protein